MPDAMPAVSVVIPNYNGSAIIGPCIESLGMIRQPHEIIVVDNGSTDGSADYIARRWPGVKLIRSAVNLGFGKACNQGAAEARGRYLLLINSDARLLTPIDAACEVLATQSDVGAVGGHLEYEDHQLQFSIGRPHSPLRLVLAWSGIRLPYPVGGLFELQVGSRRFYERPQASVPWVSAALMLVRTDAWAAVGGMTPEYFMYVEDVDFCRKLTEAGFRIHYTPDVKALHLEAGGRSWVGERALASTAESYRTYLGRYYRPWVAAATRILIGAMFALRAGIEMVRGHGTTTDASGNRVRGYLRAARIVTQDLISRR